LALAYFGAQVSAVMVGLEAPGVRRLMHAEVGSRLCSLGRRADTHSDLTRLRLAFSHATLT
jgi:hypothetical protein